MTKNHDYVSYFKTFKHYAGDDAIDRMTFQTSGFLNKAFVVEFLAKRL